MQIQISWLLQKPADLDLHCLQRQDISGFSRTRVKVFGVYCQILLSLSMRAADKMHVENIIYLTVDLLRRST